MTPTPACLDACARNTPPKSRESQARQPGVSCHVTRRPQPRPGWCVLSNQGGLSGILAPPLALPAADKLTPIGVIGNMPAENVVGIYRRFLGHMEQLHARFFRTAAALPMIAGRACRDHVRPSMQPALIAWEHVIDGEAGLTTPAILACIIVPPKNLAASQFYVRSRPMNLELKPDDGWPRNLELDGADVPPAVCHHVRLASHDQHNRTPRRADIYRLEIRVQHQDRLMHGGTKISKIIA